MDKNLISKLGLIATLFTLIVIGLGAFTRLVDAGLGCPDWPLCYGHITVPSTNAIVHQIDAKYPATPLVASKAWAEMTHRYFAGTLGLIMLLIAGLGIKINLKQKNYGILFFYGFIILLLCYQIVLGMLTVTWKLLPLIVSQHLLGGMLILSSMWLIHLINRTRVKKTQHIPRFIKIFGLIAVGLLFCQILLGAWTSTNYASLVCPDFPFCHANHPFAHWYLAKAFNLFHPVGINYDGGILSDPVRETIQMVHRSGALIVTLFLLFLSVLIQLLITAHPHVKKAMWIVLSILVIQVSLGISNVIFQLPIAVADLHSICAGLLMLSLIYLNYCFYRAPDKTLQTPR